MPSTPSPAPEIPPQYDPGATERALYARWQDAGVFTPDIVYAKSHDRFTIVIPPPNVTAVLHMGHGLNNTVQDVLVRWRRMCGDATLWVPGTDHAGIATQNIIEKQLAKEGKTRFCQHRPRSVFRQLWYGLDRQRSSTPSNRDHPFRQA